MVPGNDKQNYVVFISVTRGNGKNHTKRNVEINLSKVSLPLRYGEMLILKKWILSIHQEKIMDSEYCEGYLRSSYNKKNIIMAVLRKTNSHSVVICRSIKKSIM